MAEISLDNFLGTTEPTAKPEQQDNIISLNDFLNVKPEYPTLSDPNKKAVQDYWSSLSSDGIVSPDDTTYGFSQYSIPEAANKFKKFMVGEKSEIANHISTGFQLSNPGLIYNYLYGTEIPKGFGGYEPDTGWLEGLVQNVSTMIGDAPVYALGAWGGQTAIPIPGVGGFFGAGFLNGAVRKTMIEAINNKEVGEPVDFLKIFMEEGLKQGVKEGFQFVTAMKANKLLGKYGENYIAKSMSRWSAFEGIGALMHGELPSARDLSYSGIFWFLGTAAEGRASAIDKQKVKQKMDQIFIDTGIKPSQVITDSIKDRIIADQVASIDRKIPAAYETKKNIPEKLDMTLEQKVTDLREQLKIVQEKKLPQRVEKYTDADGNDVTRTIIDQKSAEKKTKEITKLADQIKFYEKQLETTAKSNDPAMQHMFDRMSFGEPAPSALFVNVKEKINTLTNKFLDKAVDFRNPILTDLVRAGVKDLNKVDAPINLYQEAMSLSRNKDKGVIFLKRGAIDIENRTIGKSLEEILRPIKNDPVSHAEFAGYATAVFNKTLAKRGIKTPFDIKFSDQVANNKTYKAKYETMRKEMVDFQDKVLQYVRDKGYITEKQYKAIKELNENYVPYAREILNYESELVKGKASPLKKRKGDEELRVLDPVKIIAENTIKLVELAEVNAYRLKYLEFLKENPEAFPGIKKQSAEMKPIKIQRKELEKFIPKEILDGLSDAAISEMTLFRPRPKTINPDSMVVRTKEGKIEVWQVGEERVIASNATLYKELDFLQRFSRPFVDITRIGVIFAPIFIARNIIRDTLNATIVSKIGWIPFVDSFVGLVRIIRGEILKDTKLADQYAVKLMERYEKSGGKQANILELDRSVRDTDIHSILWESPVKNKFRYIEDVLKASVRISEEMTRVRMFEKVERLAIEKKLSPKQAMERGGFEAADLLDYQRKGANLSYFNSLIPFFNPTVQGMRKSVDVFVKNPKKAMAGVFTAVILPTLLEQILYRDDPDYQQQDRQIKRNNWYIKIDGIGYWMPKGYDISIIFSEFTVSAIDMIVNDDGKQWNNFVAEYLKDSASRLITFPQFAKPFAEIILNKNLFTGNDIINPYLDRNVSDAYQAQPNTSETMKFLAEKMNGLIDADWFKKMNNPVYLDHVFKSYTATVGGYILDISDKVLAETGVVDKRFSPEKQTGDLAIAKGIVAREVPWFTSYEKIFNEKLVEFSKADGTIKLLQKQGRFDEANKLKEKYPYDLAVLKNIDTEIKKLDTAIINITNAKFEQLQINKEDFGKLSKRQQEDVLLTVRQSKYQEIRNLRRMQILLTAAGLNAINIKVAIPEIK